MDEILELQRQLAEIQETPMVQRLSDRIIIEIVDNVTKLLGVKLIFTTDGKEYIIPEHLENQIAEVIMTKGRINLNELPKILNVEIENITDKVQSLLKKGVDIILLDGNLFTPTYLDIICQEINEELEHRHKIDISELALKYNYSYDYMRNIIKARSGSIIEGTIKNNALTTLTYMNTLKSQLKGILRATVRPISLNQIKK